MNIYAVTVILSYYFCGLFPHPYYAIIALRALLFAASIALFRRRLRPLYRQAAEHWSVYLFVAVGLFMNLTRYFMAGDNVERMLRTNFVSLLLLVLLAVLVYLAIFLSEEGFTRVGTAGGKSKNTVRSGAYAPMPYPNG